MFLRDRDGQPKRARVIEKAIVDASKNPRPLRIAGGVPIEMLEAWMLALQGATKTESNRDPASVLAAMDRAHTASMVRIVQVAKLATIPADALSLRQWLRSVATALKANVPSAWP